jgi:intraflagellar transport protein 52
MEDKSQRNTIIFNSSKRELFTINSGFKTLNRKLRTSWKVTSNKEEITEERLAPARVFILAAPREKFTASEVRK